MKTIFALLMLVSPALGQVEIVSVGPPRPVAVAPVEPSAPVAVEPAPVVPAAPVHLAYPTDDRVDDWRFPQARPSRAYIIQHLKAEHGYGVDPAWFDAQTHAALVRFHTHVHTGKTRWQFVTLLPGFEIREPERKAAVQNCPGGVCPTGRPTLFGRFFGR